MGINIAKEIKAVEKRVEGNLIEAFSANQKNKAKVKVIYNSANNSYLANVLQEITENQANPMSLRILQINYEEDKQRVSIKGCIRQIYSDEFSAKNVVEDTIVISTDFMIETTKLMQAATFVDDEEEVPEVSEPTEEVQNPHSEIEPQLDKE